jgi:hypothetical protein
MTPLLRAGAAVFSLVLMLTTNGCGFCLTCQPETRVRTVRDVEMDKIAAFMVGSFSNAEQMASASGYHDLVLETARIWRLAPDGVWLYVEQALPTNRDKPFLQRIYHFTRKDEGSFVYEIYLLPDEENFIGAFADVSLFDDFSAADLTHKVGCDIHLDRLNSYTYNGGTEGSSCPSELHGASHSTTKIEIRPGRLETWEQGWSLDGQQIWGPTQGPYIFKRLPR